MHMIYIQQQLNGNTNKGGIMGDILLMAMGIAVVLLMWVLVIFMAVFLYKWIKEEFYE